MGHVLRNTVRRGPQTVVDVFAITCDIEHKILPQDDSTTTTKKHDEAGLSEQLPTDALLKIKYGD